MFGVTYMYKVAFFPYPTIFITAFSEVPAIYISEVEKNILSELTRILDKAQNSYKAILIANEPTKQTHNLNFDTYKNAVAICCSLQFQSVVDMNNFLEKEIKNRQ